MNERLDPRRTDVPYWILLPLWLETAYQKGHPERSPRFMGDILWGQYCLFLSIRLHDDFFDGHSAEPSLIYAADEFFVEAGRVFSKYFQGSAPFWSLYRKYIDWTVRAIQTADEIERRPVADRTALLAAEGLTSTICNVAAAAVCLKAGRQRDLSKVVDFSDEMMKAGAIIDDMQDMQDDLHRGRFNYATTYFLGGNRRRISASSAIRQIRKNLIQGEGLAEAFAEVHSRVSRAERAISPLKIPAADHYVRSYRQTVERMEDLVHRRRVRLVFGKE